MRERHVAGARCGYVTLPPAYCWWQRKALSNSSEWRGGGRQKQHLRGRGSRSIHQRHIKGQTCFYLPVIPRIQPATADRCCSPNHRSLEQHQGCSLNRVVQSFNYFHFFKAVLPKMWLQHKSNKSRLNYHRQSLVPSAYFFRFAVFLWLFFDLIVNRRFRILDKRSYLGTLTWDLGLFLWENEKIICRLIEDNDG